MGQTYVYNLGSYEADPSENIPVEAGLFFDGTLNNKRNTELRLKYLNELEDGKEVKDYIVLPNDTPEVAAEKRRKSQYLILPTDDEATVRAKEKLIREKRERWDKRYKKGDKTEYEKYYEADKRSYLDKQGTDNSYMNDFTNVARMWKCCTEDYKIYIEGIGTLDEQKDDDIGFQFGAGIAGIRAKVRKGCELLAEKIQKKIQKKIGSNDIEKIQKIDVTIDVFGFSRGAAAARNFLYEINGNGQNKDLPIKERKYEDVDYISPFNGKKLKKKEWVERYFYEGNELNPAYLDNGKMPNMGYLGYYLLKKNGFTIEQLKKVTLKIRFVGLYDTVSSYEKGVSKFSREAVKHTLENHLFTNDVEQLQLNNLGKPTKVVHFTAMDEHRENFDLTSFPEEMIFNKDKNPNGIVIEKEFPGVHSDIGGSYETGVEVVDEIETPNNNRNLEAERQKLIDEYWYQENQLTISKEEISQSIGRLLKNITRSPFVNKIVEYKKLTGTRFLKKEYSYIPLHLMEELFIKNITSDNVISKKSVTEYPIEGDNILVQAKKYLTAYIEGNKKEWKFIPDKIEKIDFYNTSPKTKEEKWYQENVAIKRDKTYVATNSKIVRIQPEQEDQKILRILRNKYLHWSANRDWLGMDPRKINGERKRKEF